jgi:hypothetical protein
LDPTFKADINPPWKVHVLYTVIPKVKRTLDKLKESGVMVAVEEATDWVNSLVIVEKSKDSTSKYQLYKRSLQS